VINKSQFKSDYKKLYTFKISLYVHKNNLYTKLFKKNNDIASEATNMLSKKVRGVMWLTKLIFIKPLIL